MTTHTKTRRGLTAVLLGLCLATAPAAAAPDGHTESTIGRAGALAQVAPGPGSLALLALAGATSAGRRRRSI